MAEIEIKMKSVCTNCSGKGFIIRNPGPLSVNGNLYDNIKNNNMTAEQIQEMLKTPPQHIKGVTDVELHIVCGYCNGSGNIEKLVSLDELKNLINS